MAGFEPHGFFNGEPYRLEADGSISVVRRGRIVHFGDFDAFVTIPKSRERVWPLLALLLIHGILGCVSLMIVQRYYSYIPMIRFDPSLLARAGINVLPALALLLLLAWGRPSFGYALSFYLLSVAIGFVWLIPFSGFDYDKDIATLSILASAVALLISATGLRWQLPRPPAFSRQAVDKIVWAALVLSGGILVMSATYHFRLVGLSDIYHYRDGVALPTLLRYGCGIAIGALLPYAFTLFAARGRRLPAALAAIMMAGFYPVTLLKLALFAPAWLLFLIVLLRSTGVRTAVVLSLLLPSLFGLVTMVPRAFGYGDVAHVTTAFGLTNFRMLAVPAISLDLYSDFFAHHPLTGFCQISWLKPLMACPYPDSLSETLERAYGFGTLNASLFATEGIASVGPFAAPVSVFACGLLVAVANAMSRHWPQRYVILSAAVVLQVLLSVPFSTVLLTNGAAVLFALWYLTPASYFRSDASAVGGPGAVAKAKTVT